MKENKRYTADDFKRYHAGAMPTAEMHELEKAALEDPFLADALEGYLNTPSFENDIKELKERLNKKRNKKIFSISSLAQSGWWRIAALFIIIAGAGYFFYKVNLTEKENTIAKNDIATSAIKTDSTVALKTDSVSAANDIAFENHQPGKFEEKKKTILPQIESNKEKEIIADENKKPALSPAPEMKAKKDFAYSEVNKIAANENNLQDSSRFLLKGRVTDEKGEPLAFATVKDNSNNAALTDTTGKFLLRSPDSNAIATISAPGYSPKKVTLQKDAQPMIALNRSNASLDEVVVIGYGEKRKKDVVSRSEVLKGKAAGVAITQPLANNEKFDQYIKENIKPVYNENNELQTGEILLSFTINKKGKPRNIKVIKSTCEACEDEAIRLLENSPEWPSSKNKTRIVSIKF
jgi:hypothetical protein